EVRSVRSIVRGRVSAARRAVPGVALTMIDHAGGQVARAWSGTDGRFEFPGVGSGTYVLIASRDDYPPHAESVELDGAPAVSVQVRLDATASVHGTVQDRHSGVPIVADAVTAVGSDGDVIATTVSDPDGRYNISGVDAATLTLVAAAEAADPVVRTVQFDPDSARLDQEVDLVADTY